MIYQVDPFANPWLGTLGQVFLLKGMSLKGPLLIVPTNIG